MEPIRCCICFDQPYFPITNQCCHVLDLNTGFHTRKVKKDPHVILDIIASLRQPRLFCLSCGVLLARTFWALSRLTRSVSGPIGEYPFLYWLRSLMGLTNCSVIGYCWKFAHSYSKPTAFCPTESNRLINLSLYAPSLQNLDIEMSMSHYFFFELCLYLAWASLSHGRPPEWLAPMHLHLPQFGW